MESCEIKKNNRFLGSRSLYLIPVLQFTNCANEHIACASLCVYVATGVQTESVQHTGEKTDVVTDLSVVPKLQQSRQVLQTC